MLTRAGLAGVSETLARFDPAGGPSSLLAALDDGARGDGHTTNLTVVDADGNACVLTSSLGLGSGDWVPGLDLHLNSMLGEADLVRGALVPGTRMESMMAPTLAFDEAGLELALGAAGGTRLRTALVGVLAGVLHGRLEVQDAIDRPRFHPAGRARQRGARRRRDVAPGARIRRQAGAALGRAPPLLRRGQRRRALELGRGSAPEWSRAAGSVGTVVAIQPR